MQTRPTGSTGKIMGTLLAICTPDKPLLGLCPKLVEQGHYVRRFDSSAKALREILLSGFIPDIVLADYSPADTACRELLENVRSLDCCPHVPVLFIVAAEQVNSPLLPFEHLSPFDFVRADNLNGLVHRTDLLLKLVRAERALTVRNQQQAAKSQTPSFVSLANDVGNLLMKASTAVAGLERHIPGDDRAQQHLQEMRDTIREGMELFNRVIKPSGGADLVAVNRLVESVCMNLLPTIPDSVDVRILLADEIWPVHSDAEHLETALRFLIKNAATAVGTAGSINITTTNVIIDEHSKFARGQYAKIEVSDSGERVPEEVRLELLSPSNDSKLGPEDLRGLRTVKLLLQMQSGFLDLVSGDTGNSIAILLPRAESPLRRDGVDATRSKPVVLESSNFLIIDDETQLLSVMKRELELQGHRVIATTSGKEGIEIFSQCNADIDYVILDVHLKDSDGFTVHRRLEEISEDVKIVLCTGFVSESRLKPYATRTFTSVVAKPFAVSSLLALVKQMSTQ